MIVVSVMILLFFLVSCGTNHKNQPISQDIGVPSKQNTSTATSSEEIDASATVSWDELSYEKYLKIACKEKRLTEDQLKSLENSGLAREEIRKMTPEECQKQYELWMNSSLRDTTGNIYSIFEKNEYTKILTNNIKVGTQEQLDNFRNRIQTTRNEIKIFLAGLPMEYHF